MFSGRIDSLTQRDQIVQQTLFSISSENCIKFDQMTFLTTSFLSNDSNRRKQHSIHHYLKYIKEIRVRLMTQTHISTVYT